MGLEITVTTLTAVAAVLGILLWASRWLAREKKSEFTIETDGQKIEIPSDLSAEELRKLLEIIKESPKGTKKKEQSATSSESGFVTTEFLLFVVPGVIALLFAGTFIYLLVANQNTPNYATPKELSAALTTILGYYFGVGASTAANKGKTVSARDVKKLIAERNQ